MLPYDLSRLRIRALRRGDLEPFLAYRNNPQVARYQGWDTMTRAQAARFIEDQSGARIVPGEWRQFAIADRVSDALVGDVGVWVSGDASAAEFGITVAPECQGAGYGAECTRGLLVLMFASTPVARVMAHADLRNLPCLAMLEKAGMVRAGIREAQYKGEWCTEAHFEAVRTAA